MCSEFAGKLAAACRGFCGVLSYEKVVVLLRSLLSSGMLVFGASMILNIGGFIFHAIATRKLGVADYGALYALISLYLLASMPAAIVSPVIAKFAAEFRALHDDAHVRGLAIAVARLFGALGFAYIVVAVVFASEIATFLHVATWEIPIVGLMAAIGSFTTALRAIGQGTQDFGAYALSSSSEGIGKVAMLVLLVFGGLTIAKGTTAFFIGIVLGLLGIAVPLIARFRCVPVAPVKFDWPRIAATTGGAAAVAVAAAAMGYADVVLVKHYFNPHEAGLYSVASLTGKILLYFVGFVPAVLLPHATDRFARGERTRETLGVALIFVAGACLIGVIAYDFLGGLLLRVLVGPAFAAATSLVTGYAVAMACFAATSALATYGIATHRLFFAVPLLLGTIATLAAITLSHATLNIVITEMIVGNASICVAVAAALALQAKRVRVAVSAS